MLNNNEIAHFCKNFGMITPFSERQTRRVISFGLGFFGYDVRLDRTIKRPKRGCILDPKNPNQASWDTIVVEESGRYLMSPGEFLLANTVERFRMPANVCAIAVGKSTYARVGIHPLVTPLEPGWEGHLTIELRNLSRNSVWIYPGQGILQILFFQGNRPSGAYSGKYQGQAAVPVLARGGAE